MTMIYFTADHHFNHKNIAKYCNRPYDTVEDMNQDMVEKWNDVVSDDDIVYHLGDFTLEGFNTFEKFISRLNGKIRIVPGGHDSRWLDAYRIDPDNFNTVLERDVEILPPLTMLEFPREGYPLVITLCHYPLLSWERSHYGMPHFHGHSHGTLGCIEKSGDLQMPPNTEKGQRIDVGVDCWDHPVSIIELFNELGIDIGDITNQVG